MSLPVVVSALLPACAAAGGRSDAARSAPAPARPAAASRRVLLRAGPTPNPFSTEPGAWSSAFEKRDDSKPKKSSGGVATAPAEKLAPGEVPDVPLTSECGADYTLLRDLLMAGEWQKADDETRLKMCELAGEEAEAREWVYFTEVKEIPAADLVTIDALWKAHSGGRYGFSVQRGLYLAEKRKWGAFFKRIGWTMGDNGAYRKFPTEFLWQADAPKGHLPLTNCLRGTQLLAALLEHPAFGGALEVRGVRARSSGAGGSTLGGGGPPPLEALEPTARAALVAATLLLVLLGLANQG